MVELKPGDFFCTDGTGGLSRVITWFERMRAKDGRAEFCHCGTIIDSVGKTIESLATIRYGHISDYAGRKVLIGRWRGMTPQGHAEGVKAISDDIGQIYPFWRLPLHALGIAWISSGKFQVCSERVAQHLIVAGFDDIGKWEGQNPDDIADMIRRWRDVEIVFDGTWQKETR